MSPADLADAEREARINHILADYFDAVERGEYGDPERMLIRHPDLAVELKAFFAEQEQVFGLAGPLRSLIRAEHAVSPRTETFSSEEAGGGISSAAPRCFGDYEVVEEAAHHCGSWPIWLTTTHGGGGLWRRQDVGIVQRWNS